MEQALLEEVVLEQGEVVAEAEWEAPVLVQDQLVSVYVLPVQLLFLIKWGFPAIK
jgi:hypothetical protein